MEIDGEVVTAFGCHLRDKMTQENYFLYHLEKETRDEFVELVFFFFSLFVSLFVFSFFSPPQIVK